MTTTSNTFGNLNSVLREIATCAAMGAAYKSWADEFSRKEVREVWNDEAAPLRKQRGFRFTVADLRLMTKEERATLGFGNWDDKLTVIPLWAFNYVADGETLVSISGDSVVKGVDPIDLDVRFGAIAFGFIREDEMTAA